MRSKGCIDKQTSGVHVGSRDSSSWENVPVKFFQMLGNDVPNDLFMRVSFRVWIRISNVFP